MQVHEGRTGPRPVVNLSAHYIINRSGKAAACLPLLRSLRRGNFLLRAVNEVEQRFRRVLEPGAGTGDFVGIGVQDVIEVQFKPEYEDFQPDVLFLNPNNSDYIRFTSYQGSNGYNWDPYCNENLLYACENDAIHVDDYGFVQAGSEKGVFPVTIFSINGITKQTQVIVYENEDINGMRIEAVPEHNPVYKTIQLNALVSIFGEELPGNQFVTWESDNSSVATVNSNGAVRTLGYGSAVITATDINGNTDSVTINVLQAPDNFTLPTTVTV